MNPHNNKGGLTIVSIYTKIYLHELRALNFVVTTITRTIITGRDTDGVLVIIMENELGDQSSNLALGCMHFIWLLCPWRAKHISFSLQL